jgi:hypothetical protein
MRQMTNHDHGQGVIDDRAAARARRFQDLEEQHEQGEGEQHVTHADQPLAARRHGNGEASEGEVAAALGEDHIEQDDDAEQREGRHPA